MSQETWGGSLVLAEKFAELYVPSRGCARCVYWHETPIVDKDGETQYVLACVKRHKPMPDCEDFSLNYSIAEYQQAGICLGEYIRQARIAMGKLARVGFEIFKGNIRINDEPIETLSDWQAFSGRLWGVTRGTVVKAMVLDALQEAGVLIPEDMSLSIVYEIAAAVRSKRYPEALRGSLEEIGRIIDMAFERNWNQWDIRRARNLIYEGIFDDWVLPDLVIAGKKLQIRVGNEEETIAVLENGDSRLYVAARHLLYDHPRIVESEEEDS